MFSKNKILKIKKYYLNIYLNKIYFKKTKTTVTVTISEHYP